jgi:hypothetical protein
MGPPIQGRREDRFFLSGIMARRRPANKALVAIALDVGSTAGDRIPRVWNLAAASSG